MTKMESVIFPVQVQLPSTSLLRYVSLLMHRRLPLIKLLPAAGLASQLVTYSLSSSLISPSVLPIRKTDSYLGSVKSANRFIYFEFQSTVQYIIIYLSKSLFSHFYALLLKVSNLSMS